MIVVTKLDNRVAVVNAELIKMIESAPDTILTFINGDTVIVQETVEEIVNRALDYQKNVRGLRIV